MRNKFCIIAYVFVLVSCNTLQKSAWKVAGTNPELVSFLEHYKNSGDNIKYSAACFLVKNMQDEYYYDSQSGKRVDDVDVIVADSLIRSLEYSFELLKTSPYLSDISFEDFCKYILPYRVANEPLTYYWKWDSRKYLQGFQYSGDIDTDATTINRLIHLDMHPENYSSPLKSYGDLIDSGFGTCDDRAILTVMRLRSVGIMASFEYVPFWGSSNNGHSFATVILPDGSIAPLPNTDEKGKEFSFERKTPKVFRKIYDGDGNLDVTSLHDIGFRDIKTDSDATNLCVFSPEGWRTVARGDSGKFRNIGTGTDRQGRQADEAAYLGNGIVYLPMKIEKGIQTPCSEPIIVSHDQTVRITPDVSQTESVTLTRKFPLNKRIVQFAKNMRLGTFEGANRTDFYDAESLYTIKDIPESNVQTVCLDSSRPYRYIRYRRPMGTFSIAEFALQDKDGRQMDFKPVCDESIAENDMMKIFDNDPLTYFEVNGAMDLWIGADLGSPQPIGAISFAPRNDDNSICPGHVYELMYWDGTWKTIGRQVSSGSSVSFDNVPSGALLWLRDLSKGKEERPFTYSEGIQVWW